LDPIMTKLITLAAAVLALTAGAAVAENTFQLDRARSTASSLTLNNVQADQAGTVQVWGYNEDGRVDRFLGQTELRPGATGDLEVVFSQPNTARRLQILMSNGNHAVAKLEVRDAPTS
jgi:hypothetical protein